MKREPRDFTTGQWAMSAWLRVLVCCAGLLLAWCGVGTAAEASCSGPACGDFAFSADGCELINKGAKPIQVSILADIATTQRVFQGRPQFIVYTLAPAETQQADRRYGCLHPVRNIRVYRVTYMAQTPPPQAASRDAASAAQTSPPQTTSRDAASLLFGRRGPSCAGDACGRVSFQMFKDCVWLQSTDSRPIMATVTVGHETLTLALEGADLARAEARKADASERQKQARECARVLAAAKQRDELRARGLKIPFDPQIDGRADGCNVVARNEGQASTGGRTAQPGYHVSRYSALSNSSYAVFMARLQPSSGCVKQVQDIASSTANYGTPVTTEEQAGAPPARHEAAQDEGKKTARPAAKKNSLDFPCSGDACGALLAESHRVAACQVLNGGDRDIRLKVIQRSGGELTMPSLKPGKAAALGTPMGCIPPRDIKGFEASYN